MMLRILASITLLLSVLFMPFWVSIMLAFAGMVFFEFFWEAVLLLLLSDLLYGVRETRFVNIIFISFIIAVIMLTLIEIIKKKTRLR